MTEPPSPDLIISTLNAHQRSAALRGAIELDLFTTIARGHQDVDSIARHCGGQPRAIRILCDFLTINGFLIKQAKGTYDLTPTSATFLDRESPAYLGSIARFVNSRELLDAFADVASLVRRGTTNMKGAGAVEPNWDGWVEFARSMAPMMAPAAEQIATFVAAERNGPIKVLDVAAGHGMFGVSVAQKNPQARIVALDWEVVLEVAAENAAAAGLGDRHELMPGDATTVDFGTGFDVVLLTNFLHHFDREECVRILQKARNCLNPSGLALTLEFVPNDDRISPPIPATFSFMMLGTTQAGDAYTFKELDAMCRAAGFSRNELVALEDSPQSLVVSKV